MELERSRQSAEVVTPGEPGQHDGKVGLDETRYDSAADFIVVPHGHTFIMAAPEVIHQSVAFLRTGRFEHQLSSPGSPP